MLCYVIYSTPKEKLAITKCTTTTYNKIQGQVSPNFGVAGGAHLLFCNPKPLRTKALYYSRVAYIYV